MSIARRSFEAKAAAHRRARAAAEAEVARKAAAAAEPARVQPAIATAVMPAPVQTPAQRTRVRKQTTVEQADGSALRGDLTQYEQHLAKLQQDRLRLKQVQSKAAKSQIKRELVAEYDAYLDGVLAADTGSPDEVLTTLLVWNIDAGRFERALELAAYAFRHGLETADRFRRTLGTLVAEEIAEAALDALAAGDAVDRVPVDVLARTAELVTGQDMPDEVRAKLFLALGRSVLADAGDAGDAPGAESLSHAVDWLQQAIALHAGCGGKKDLERAQRLLKKQAGPAG